MSLFEYSTLVHELTFQFIFPLPRKSIELTAIPYTQKRKSVYLMIQFGKNNLQFFHPLPSLMKNKNYNIYGIMYFYYLYELI